jgi:hypothetical protein
MEFPDLDVFGRQFVERRRVWQAVRGVELEKMK